MSEHVTVRFLERMATLLEAGVPVSSAASMVARDQGAGRVRRLALCVCAELAGGASLDRALTRAPGKIPSGVVALVRDGLAAGRPGPAVRAGAGLLRTTLAARDVVAGRRLLGWTLPPLLLAVAIVAGWYAPWLATREVRWAPLSPPAVWLLQRLHGPGVAPMALLGLLLVMRPPRGASVALVLSRRQLWTRLMAAGEAGEPLARWVELACRESEEALAREVRRLCWILPATVIGGGAYAGLVLLAGVLRPTCILSCG